MQVNLSGIKNRRDFHATFQDAMSGAHETLRAFWLFEKEQYLPKSYLIEFHPSGSHDQAPSTEGVFSALDRASRGYGGELRRTDDDALFWLGHSEKGYAADFIIDSLNPRFLVFHTISKVDDSDRFIMERLTQYQPEFDLFWFPVALLERMEKRERITGWEAQFQPLIDVDFLGESEAQLERHGDGGDVSSGPDEEFEDPPARLLRRPRLTIDLEYLHAFDTYKKLKDDQKLLPDIPLNAVIAERDDEDFTSYARARIKSNGKITGRGPDFSSYLQIVNGTLDDYASVVEGLESRYWIRTDARETDDTLAITLRGEPFCVMFHREIDLKRLLGLMLNCKGPFRLMGEVECLGDNYFAVDAIDLHINQPVGFEITPKWMRIYLYEGTCGNTLVRIIRSLQHHVDSRLQHPPLA